MSWWHVILLTIQQKFNAENTLTHKHKYMHKVLHKQLEGNYTKSLGSSLPPLPPEENTSCQEKSPGYNESQLCSPGALCVWVAVCCVNRPATTATRNVPTHLTGFDKKARFV